MNRFVCLLPFVVLCARPAHSQREAVSDSLLNGGTLQDCVRYALAHQPTLRQSLLDEQITERIISGKLADWYPQVNFSYNVQHYYQIPVSIVGGNPVNVSLNNSSTGQFSVTQTIVSRDVLLASSTAEDLRDQSRHRTTGSTIDVVVNVSKAFYAALLTQEQIDLLDEDIVRLEQSLKDAYNQYQGGIVDKTDYKRATVALNNARSERRQNAELLKTRFAQLKERMGYPSGASLELMHDSTAMEKEILIDTAQAVNYENRVEYQLLQIQKRLDEANLHYNQWSFFPSLTAFGDYDLNYQNNEWPPLYRHNYPSSVVGLQLTLPVFQGGRRIQELKQAELELERFDYDMIAFRNAVNTEYTQALANYKSNLNNYNILKENLELARDVFRTVELQYRAGTKTYLELISAETDLRSAQVNRTNALEELLSSKLDVQKALGTLQY